MTPSSTFTIKLLWNHVLKFAADIEEFDLGKYVFP